ncbi:T9SS type A sorting domain-containing protein [Paucihalobacter sp.]|uniref:T9SS type A sorting domain-containing protein n=1 Tax=Paucihalobacter sp. TaxID=2850405 RepID=UPI002FE07121
MKRFILCLLAIAVFYEVNSQITAAEYFFDTDPGFGNGVALSVNGEELNQNFDIPTTGLSNGIHKLNIRVQKQDGTWSIYGTEVFYIGPSNSANIASAEYFFNTDPGFGNGINLSFSGEFIDQNFIIPTEGLPIGVHKLFVRVTNTDGTWSLYNPKVFYRYPNETNTASISRAEYFFDTDPGLGNGTVLAMSGEMSDENFTIAEVLDEGIHNLFVRVLNIDGTWSLYNRKLLYVYPKNTALITAAEYFFDIDPGFGNATPINLDAVENLDEDLEILVPEDLPDGDHYLYVRVLNSDGVWSLYATSEMLSTLSISELSKQQLKLYPNPVQDYLFLDTCGATVLDFKIIDLTGQIILDVPTPNEKVDLSHLSTGAYLVYLTTNQGRWSQKIVKQ